MSTRRRGERLVVVVAVGILGLVTACGGSSGSADAVGACRDGADNDFDLLVDFPADPGCDSEDDPDESNPPIAQCNDGRDNDADGKADFPADPGCVTLLQNSETDDCPDGPDCPACGNGMDDDTDGVSDYPNDNGCDTASDNDEYVTNPAACGAGLIVTRLQTDDVTGMLTSGGVSNLTGSCGGAGAEVAYELVLAEPAVIVASTDSGATTANTVLYLRDDCQMPTTELACSNDIVAGTNTKSELTASVPAGTYYLIIDNAVVSGPGNFALHVDFFSGEGTACTTTDECGPGLICRVPSGETEMVCSDPVCSDGRDDDADGTPDFPGDPGCDGPADADEVDDCPSGPNCPACSNDLDDDGDTLIDYGLDPDCSSASQPLEGCGAEQDPMLLLTAPTTTGDLSTLHNDFPLACGGAGGNDRVYVANLPAMSTITFDTITTAFDTVLAVYPSSCGTSIACNDDASGLQSVITLTNLAAGTYALVMAAYSSGLGGPYTLHTTGTIAPGGACDGALAASGAITCSAGLSCVSGTCQ